MADDILLVMAKREGRYIAGAINFIGADALYGRHWGCVEDHPFLHFEVCYHQAIDFALAKSLKRVEAGAQGEHKLARGYLPVTTHSVHDLTHPGLRRAVADYLKQEREQVAEMNEILTEHSPFRKGELQQRDKADLADTSMGEDGGMTGYDPNNIFGKILRGEIPSVRVYEDEHAVAFMDVMPQAPGHVLVIPREGSRNMLDADPVVLAHLIPVVQKVAVAVREAFDADGVYIAQFNEPAAGQTVFHLHFHVVPRNEGQPLKPHSGSMENIDVLKANAEKIKAELPR